MKVCLMDMDDRTRQSMALVFKHRAKNTIALTDEDEADVAVIDLDSGVEKSLSSLRSVRSRRPALRAVVLASGEAADFDDAVILQKPISAGGLLAAIQEASGKQLETTSTKLASVASSLASRVTSGRRRPEASGQSEDLMFFDPQEYLLGTLMKAAAEARERDMVAIISFYGDRIIGLDGKGKSVETNLTSAQARAFAISSVNANEEDGNSSTVGFNRPVVEYVTHDAASKRFAGKTYSVPYEIFMWKLGMTTSRGRLPKGMSVDARVFLRRWPGMTRFSYSDNEMRIIAYWVRQAASLREISEALGLPLSEVCSVYTAACVSGLSDQAKRADDKVWEAPEVEEHKERGIFSSIMKHLLKRKPADGGEEE